VTGETLEIDDADFRDALSAEGFVRRRDGLGGPAPSEVHRQIAVARSTLAKDAAYHDDLAGRLALADARLDRDVDAFVARADVPA
jgi:hypothetical protein